MYKLVKYSQNISLEKRSRRKEKGQTLGEYILILLLVAITAIVALGLFGNNLNAIYQRVVASF
jgi:Flp pilus assembly pilin Flp